MARIQIQFNYILICLLQYSKIYMLLKWTHTHTLTRRRTHWVQLSITLYANSEYVFVCRNISRPRWILTHVQIECCGHVPLNDHTHKKLRAICSTSNQKYPWKYMIVVAVACQFSLWINERFARFNRKTLHNFSHQIYISDAIRLDVQNGLNAVPIIFPRTEWMRESEREKEWK